MELLSLDLSTTVGGYSIFDKETDELILIDYYKFTSEDLVDRGKELVDLLEGIYKNNPSIDEIAIEERLKSFRSGGTNANAMLSTAQMNFLCQYVVKNIFKKNITEINVNTARSSCFEGFHKLVRAQKGTKHKEIAFKMARAILGDAIFPTKVLKSGPRKGETIFIEEAMDMADSWVIGKAILNNRKKPVVEPKVKKKKAKE